MTPDIEASRVQPMLGKRRIMLVYFYDEYIFRQDERRRRDEKMDEREEEIITESGFLSLVSCL